MPTEDGRGAQKYGWLQPIPSTVSATGLSAQDVISGPVIRGTILMRCREGVVL
jgi:hypothetical protein